MKKFLLFLVAAMLAIVARAADGDTFTYQGLEFSVTSEENHTVSVGKNPNASGDISIPSFVVNGSSRYFVTGISDGAFRTDWSFDLLCYPTRLTSVTIPNSVTFIEQNAFANCVKLTSVNIPDAVTEIKARTFYNCSSQTSINIPNSVTEIRESAFQACSSLTSVTIPNSVTKIGLCAFQSCSSLTSVNIPNSVTTIGLAAFQECSSLTSVNIPNSVTTIAAYAFCNCSKLTTIYDLNPTPQIIDDNAFDLVPTDAVVYIPKGSFNKYFVADGWTQFTDFREMGAFDVALSEQSIELTVGSTATVAATVTKDDDMTIESEEWSSSKPEVATVDNGVITAVAPGEAVIWFTAVDGYGVPHTEQCEVTVSGAPILVQSITLNLNSVEAVEGDEFRLTATVTPDNASDKTVAWSSSDETVATVSAEGLVKVLKEGSCVITAATTDGSNLKAECQVSVFAGIDDILCDTAIPVEIFNLQGVKVSTTIEHLPAGLYIVRQGNTVKKVAVK